ncbi:MAG: hypothetical protein U0R66_04555 [Mycobacterium sp.]
MSEASVGGARFVGRNRHAAVGEWTTLSVTMLIEREPHRAREIVDNRLAEFRASMQTTLEGIRALVESG